MDKRVIFAVAGSGKTTHIVNSLAKDKRSLIVTYTNNNYANLTQKILDKFDDVWPENVTLMTFFQFLYRFCYKPFLADIFPVRGIWFESNPNQWLKQSDSGYYLSETGYLYSNRLSLFLEKKGVISDIRNRLEKYFDEFIIDEVQDIAGWDFDFLEQLIAADVDMLFVGDFFQHTYDTSRDGNKNKNLFNNRDEYTKRFVDKGIVPDVTTLTQSWRCSKTICEYISNNLGIEISSNRTDDTVIDFISDLEEIGHILEDESIVKLHYRESSKHGLGHKNWGETKGEDCYNDVCVMLNKTTMQKYQKGKLSELAPATRNKLYVAITRAHGNVFLISEEALSTQR